MLQRKVVVKVVPWKHLRRYVDQEAMATRVWSKTITLHVNHARLYIFSRPLQTANIMNQFYDHYDQFSKNVGQREPPDR